MKLQQQLRNEPCFLTRPEASISAKRARPRSARRLLYNAKRGATATEKSPTCSPSKSHDPPAPRDRTERGGGPPLRLRRTPNKGGVGLEHLGRDIGHPNQTPSPAPGGETQLRRTPNKGGVGLKKDLETSFSPRGLVDPHETCSWGQGGTGGGMGDEDDEKGKGSACMLSSKTKMGYSSNCNPCL